RQCEISFAGGEAALEAGAAGDGVIRAPMHGRIVAIDVAPGDSVSAGDRLAVLEAMKMEHVLAAPVDGVVSAVNAAQGDQVDEGAAVLVVDVPPQQEGTEAE
ncbi:MAG: acetyl-CoA carboxylase biotin carboxyl carrier protein subunit, partial [Alphaproteobacteria bacterium]